jgi:hypothetical protein
VAFLVTGVIRRILCVTAMYAFSGAVPLLAQNAAPSPQPADYDDADGCVVLSLLLDHYHSAAENILQISSLTTTSGTKPGSFESCATKMPGEFAAAINDYTNKNKQDWRLAKKFNFKFGYKLLDLAKKHQPLAPTPDADGVPPPLFERAVYQVSAVGFDASRTHAIAYVTVFCGPDCSSGAYHLLLKEKGGWKEIVNSPVCEWMSFHSDGFFDRSPS